MNTNTKTFLLLVTVAIVAAVGSISLDRYVMRDAHPVTQVLVQDAKVAASVDSIPNVTVHFFGDQRFSMTCNTSTDCHYHSDTFHFSYVKLTYPSHPATTHFMISTPQHLLSPECAGGAANVSLDVPMTVCGVTVVFASPDSKVDALNN